MDMTFSLILSLTAHATLAIVCAAILMLALWQGITHHSNRRLALAMFVAAAFGGAGVLTHFGDALSLSPSFVLFFSTSAYGISTLALFDFLTEFGNVPRSTRRVMRLFGVSMGFLLIPLIWSGVVFINPVKLPDATIKYDLTALGLVVVTIVAGYQLVGIGLIRANKTPENRTLWRTVLILPVAAAYSATFGIQGQTIDAISFLTVSLVVGRAVIRKQIFEPNVLYNRQLAEANEELIRVNKRKTEFLATISHELRTPLNSIINYTEMILMNAYGPLSEQQIDRLTKIDHSGRRVLSMVSDVLDLSKIEAGHLTLNIVPLNTAEQVQAVLHIVQPEADRRGLRLDSQLLAELPAVYADQSRFAQILQNLLTNAIQHTYQGQVTLSVRPIDRLVLFSISDTGDGLTVEQMQTIFEPIQARIMTDRRPGLELAVTRHLVRLHGGQLWVESEGLPGKGATFSFTLPIAEELSSVTLPQAAPMQVGVGG